MSLIPFPDVPKVPGVPDLPRGIYIPSAGEVLYDVLDNAIGNFLGYNNWGIFDKNGKDALEADSIVEVEYRNESQVSNYIQEQGAFASYNKVDNPYEFTVSVAIAENLFNRSRFIRKIEGIRKSLDLFSVVTPENTYLNATLQGISYHRDNTRVSLIIVEMLWIEVRNTGTVETLFDNTREVSGADAVDNGVVQTYAVEAYDVVVRELQ